MKVGVTGHQERHGIRWSWVTAAIRDELMALRPVEQALSSLAVGADQVFAEAVVSLNIPLVAVVPLDDYERFFHGAARAEYRRLLNSAEVLPLRWRGDPERAFFEAGKFIVTHCDLLIAVWDGQTAGGLGGTGDVVGYAQMIGRQVLHLNPCDESCARI